jgi:hypothetical protein
MRHKAMEINLELFEKKTDELIERELQENVDKWTPKILAVQKRLKHSPEKFAYEIRQTERMLFLLNKQKFFGEGFQRMLYFYSLMS